MTITKSKTTTANYNHENYQTPKKTGPSPEDRRPKSRHAGA